MNVILSKPTSKSSIASRAREATALKRALDAERARYEAEYGRIIHDAGADLEHHNAGVQHNESVDDAGR